MRGIKLLLDSNPWILVLFRVLVIVFVTYLAQKVFRKIWHKAPGNQSLYRKFTYNILTAVIYMVGVLTAIGQIPVLSKVTQTILAGSGIVALAISLSAQESLNNIISGMFLTLFKPFEVGDRIVLVNNNITGLVEDITLRHTVIKTFVNTRIVIPNATMNQEIIENSNLTDSKASAYIDVSVAYESNIERAMEIMANVISSHPAFVDVRTEEEKKTKPIVKVYVRALGDSGVSLRANMWTRTVNQNFEACSDVRLQLKRAFDAEGIEIPYTKYTILHQD